MKKAKSRLAAQKIADDSQSSVLERRFVSRAELEKITGVKRRTWEKHALFGTGPTFYKIGGAAKYDLSEVIAWIRSRKVTWLTRKPEEF